MAAMNNHWSCLHLKVSDKKTGRLMPARMHIKQTGGNCYVPPAKNPEKPGQLPSVITPPLFRKNLRLCQKIDIQSSQLSTGEAVFPVPAGKLTIFIARGYDWHPFVKTVSARSGETTTLECELPMVENTQGRGWYSGDMHVHFTRNNRSDDLLLAGMMAAEGLSAINNMVYKQTAKIEPMSTPGTRSISHTIPTSRAFAGANRSHQTGHCSFLRPMDLSPDPPFNWIHRSPKCRIESGRFHNIHSIVWKLSSTAPWCKFSTARAGRKK